MCSERGVRTNSTISMWYLQVYWVFKRIHVVSDRFFVLSQSNKSIRSFSYCIVGKYNRIMINRQDSPTVWRSSWWYRIGIQSAAAVYRKRQIVLTNPSGIFFVRDDNVRQNYILRLISIVFWTVKYFAGRPDWLPGVRFTRDRGALE